MKYCKRILSLLVALGMVFSMVSTMAFAETADDEEDVPALTLDATVSKVLDGTARYSFTPSEDGYYAFWVDTMLEESNNYAYGEIEDMDCNERYYDVENNDVDYYDILEEYHICYCYMLADETYYCLVKSRLGSTTEAVEFGITKRVEVEALYFERTEMICDPYKWNGVSGMSYEPMFSFVDEDDITWTVSDESVVCVWEYSPGESFGYETYSPGVATVTASLDNGVSASCVVVVPEETTAETVGVAVQAAEDGTVQLSAEASVISLNAEAVQTLKDAEGVEQLSVALEDGVTVTLDETLLALLLNQASSVDPIILYVDEIPLSALNYEQRNALSGEDVAVVLSARLLCGYTEISDFQGGTVEIRIPFTFEEGESASDYRLYYIADSGELTEVEFKYDDTGYMVFTLEHFSEYVITRVSTSVCDHTWNAATCTTPKTCSACGATEGTTLGHTWSAATCTAPKTCSACGATEGAALGHSWSAATCTAPKTCSACGATEGTALGHTWSEATCTAPKVCSDCKATDGDALGHSYVSVVSAPTCTDVGYTTYTCSACGHTCIGDEIAALGHSDTNDDGVCDTCSYKMSGYTGVKTGDDSMVFVSSVVMLAAGVVFLVLRRKAGTR